MIRRQSAPQLMLCFVFVGLLSMPLRAQRSMSLADSAEFDHVAPPATASWRLATDDGRFVEFAVQDIPANVGFSNYIVTPDNAAEFGVDFAAWQLAVNDLAYTRSILTFSGQTQEEQVMRTFDHLTLDRLRITVRSYYWPDDRGVPHLTLGGRAIQEAIVPEASTWLLLLMGCGSIALHSRGRRSVCLWRSPRLFLRRRSHRAVL
jgi:hypothetical protein